MFGTHVDISERKRHEALLEETQKRRAELFLMSTQGFAHPDTAGMLVHCNPLVGDLLGLPIQPMVTLFLRDITHENEVERLKSAFLSTARRTNFAHP